MADEAIDEQRNAQLQFVAAGQMRIAAPLDALNSLADRLGGQNGMMLYALHGTLSACFSAMLNHIAGIPEAEPVPHETDPSVDRTSAAVDPQPAAADNPEPIPSPEEDPLL